MGFEPHVNNAVSNGAEALYEFLSHITGGAMATAATYFRWGDGTNGHTPTAGGSGFSAAALKEPKAWVAVNLQGGLGTLLIQKANVANTDNTAFWIAFAKGGLNADGDGDTVPTPVVSGDLKDVWGTSGAPAQLFDADNTPTPSIRWHVNCEETSPYRFWCGGLPVGVNEARTIFYMDIPSVDASDTAAPVFYADYRSSGPFAGSLERTYSVSQAKSHTWHRYGLSGASWSVAIIPVRYCDSTIVFPRNLQRNPYTNHDALQYVDWYYVTSSLYYYKGTSTFVAYNGTARSSGTTFDPTGVGDDRLVLGDISVPWPAGVPASL